MIRMTACVCLVALWVCAAGAAFAADDASLPSSESSPPQTASVRPPDAARPDPRLDQPVTISVAYDSLDEFCAKLGETSGVSIRVDPIIKEQKVVVRVREQPLRELMRQVAVLFEFTWMQGPQEHPRYRLTASAARMKRAEELRQRFTSEREAHYRHVLKDTLRAMNATPAELRELARTDPDAVALAVFPDAPPAALRGLDEAAVDAVLAGQVVTVPFTALSPSTQQAIKAKALRQFTEPIAENWPWDATAIAYERGQGRPWTIWMSLQLPTADPRRIPSDPLSVGGFVPDPLWWLIAALLEDSDDVARYYPSRVVSTARTLVDFYGIDPIKRTQAEVAGYLPQWAQSVPHLPAPQPSRRLVPLRESKASEADQPLQSLPDLLRAVAEKLDVSLVADCYWTNAVRSLWARQYRSPSLSFYPADRDEQGRLSIDANAEFAVDRMCEQRGYGWTKDSDVLRVRNLLWFADDPEEVPASVLNEWMRRTDNEKTMRPEDWVYLVSNVSERLAKNLRYTECKGRGIPRANVYVSDAQDYYAMKLYALLPPALQAQTQTVGVGVAQEMPSGLMPMLELALTDQRDKKNRLRELTPQQFAALRLWSGNRAREVPFDDAGQRYGVYENSFCVELWSGAAPDWSGEGTKHPGRIAGWWYFLSRASRGKE